MNARHALVLAPLLGAILAGPAGAADPPNPLEPGPWKLASTAALTLTQSSFSNNWSGGDQGSIVWVLGTDSNAERQFSTAFNSSNHLVVAYGQTSQQRPKDAPQQNQLMWEAPEKSTDKIEFESVERWTLQTFVDPFLALRFDSQFLDLGSDPTPLRRGLKLNPVRLKETAGIARLLFKTEDSEGISRLGFGVRQTFAQAFQDSTDRKNRITANDGGFEWQTNITKPILEKKVLYKGQLLLFQPLFYSKANELKKNVPAAKDYWRTINVDFQNTFNAAITKYLGVNLFAQFAYAKFDAAADVTNPRDVHLKTRKAGQFKETLSLALTYRLL
jgi:hypothetical protein